jgi:hypothetical protein
MAGLGVKGLCPPAVVAVRIRSGAAASQVTVKIGVSGNVVRTF